jgi:hypothetical protein
MLRETTCGVSQDSSQVLASLPWASSSRRPHASSDASPAWLVIDRALRTLAGRRAALDAEEARWLREAERCEIWRELGMVSVLDYMDRVLGYAPRTAQERLRVARALGELPVLSEALASGRLPYSAIRELTRVAMPGTERAWCEAAMGKNLRQIEELVADHQPGDRPEDPGDPAVRMRVVRFELSAETFALLRQTQQVLDEERGARLSDDEVMAALCHAVLDGAAGGGPTGRAKHQIALTVCKRCEQGWQEGAGVRVAVDASTVEQARCDAQEIGALESENPARAHQAVAPSVMRLVWRRDGGHCRVPGCRSTRGLEIHHIVHRAHGGGHEASNLVLVCRACHSAHHKGQLKMRGTAEALEIERCAERRVARAHVGACEVAAGVPGNREVRTQAKEALVGLGWRPAIAAAAVDAAVQALGESAGCGDAGLERLIFEALRRCRQPAS